MPKVDKPFKAMTNDELIVILEQFVSTSVKYYDTKLSKERQTVTEYYNGSLPKPAHAGNSKYVSLDVFDAVESMKAELLETFAAGNRIVSFDALSAEQVEQARIQTSYCDYVVFGQNDGYSIFSAAIQNGLMARAGVAKVFWDKSEEESEEEFENLTIDEVDALSSNGKYELSEVEQDPETGLFSGDVTSKIDKSQVRIEVLPPEEFIVEGNASCLDEVTCGHRTRKTLSDLLKMGIDSDLVASLPSYDENTLNTDPEVLARFESISPERGLTSEETQRQNSRIFVYEIYIELDMEGEGETKLYKCLYAGGKLLDEPEEVSRRPFVTFVPLPVTHSFYGSNYAAKVIPTQNARTILTRSILDHTLITNNPRYMVVKGALTNPREMLENRMGGLVNVSRPDGIIPLPQASLNPFVFQTIQLLDEDKEETTGISKLSQGMSKDAVSKQNSAGMVEQLVSMSQKRQKIIARNFANQFIKRLYIMVYSLVNANEQKEKVIKVSGNFMRVNPQEWDERTEATVELKLGYGEQEQEAQKFLGIHQMLSQDPTLQPLYQLPNKYALLTDAYAKAGIVNIKSYLTSPEQIPPPQPDPKMMMDMHIQEKTLEIQERQVAVGEKKLELQSQVENMALQLQKMKQDMENMNKQHELALKSFEVHSRLTLEAKELDMASKAAPESTKALISSGY